MRHCPASSPFVTSNERALLHLYVPASQASGSGLRDRCGLAALRCPRWSPANTERFSQPCDFHLQSCLSPPSTPSGWLPQSFFADTGEEGFGGLIRGVLGDEVACEGACQNALFEAAQQFQGLCGLGGKAVDLGEGGFDTADDFVMFIERGQRNRSVAADFQGKIALTRCSFGAR